MKKIIETLTPTIFTRDFFCDFNKIKDNVFLIKVELNILNALLGETENIEEKFIALLKQYPEVREVLPILLATRNPKLILDKETKEIIPIENLFKRNEKLIEKDALDFLNKS
jgi:type II restriction enzyme